MKKLFFTFAALLSFTLAFAQDVIIKKNGEEVAAKILELTPELIKYKRFDYQEGPIISLSRSEVFMIKYENGTKEMMGTGSTTATPTATSSSDYPLIHQEIKLGGPRIGFTVIGGHQADHLREEYSINPFLTQFGWQFESRMFTTAGGLSGLAELVPLIGGLEQGKFLPSLNALVGLRNAKGLELGIGPNLSLAGAGLVFAVGTSFHSQGINFPLNFAVVPGNDGVRFSVLFGFNSRRD